jgi:hypothetical protein
MEMNLEVREALVLMLRDFEMRRLPQVLDLLDEAACGSRLEARDHAFLDDLLRDIDHAAGLVDDDLESRLAVLKLRACATDLRDEVMALASASQERSQAIV